MAKEGSAVTEAGWQEKVDKAIHEKNFFTDLLEKAEKLTGVKRLYIVLGLAALVGLWLLVGYGAQFLCNFIGFLYPAYASLKAIESTGKDDDTKWLTYWVVYSTFSLIEFFTDIFLFWIPFYSFLKCMFLMYCMAPTSWNGSITIYQNIIRPFVLKHEKNIDEALNKAGDVLGEVLSSVTKTAQKATDEAKTIASGAVTDTLRQRLVDSTSANEETK